MLPRSASSCLLLVVISTHVMVAGCGRDQRIFRADTTSVDVEGVGKGGGGSESVLVVHDVNFQGQTGQSLLIADGILKASGTAIQTPVGATVVDGGGAVVFPGFVDSHVHLTYYPAAAALAAAGVLGAIDLAAPLSAFETRVEDLTLLLSGPMITSENGYPTQSWGSNGYGYEVSTVEQARSAARDLLDQGARVLKVPLDGSNVLSDEQVEAIVSEAHNREVRVAAHALSDDAAQRARRLGCDILAHTPTEELSAETLRAWGDGAVISTLRAFGASPPARENLAALHGGGTRVLYGTDFGNSRHLGIDVVELALLEEVGLSRREALEAGTVAASEYWKIDEGNLSEGKMASFILLAKDPSDDLDTLRAPTLVVYRGRVLAGLE